MQLYDVIFVSLLVIFILAASLTGHHAADLYSAADRHMYGHMLICACECEIHSILSTCRKLHQLLERNMCGGWCGIQVVEVSV